MTNQVSKSAAADLLAHEFAQEKASALGRLGRAFAAALTALAEFDRSRSPGECSVADRKLRAALLQDASAALWHFIVQREACGLRDMRHVLRDYGVPIEVSDRMGICAPAALTAKPSRRT
jgi:hypothetical protein